MEKELETKIGNTLEPVIKEYYSTDSQSSVEIDKAKVEMIKRTSRRRQAWISLFSIVAVTLLLIFGVSEERLKALDTVLPFFYITMGSIIGAYHGFSAWLGKKQ